MEVTGVIKWVGQMRNGTSASGAWKSVEFVVEEQTGQYPRSYALSVFNKESLFPLLQVGAAVTASFDGCAREYNGRWYNDLRCWKIVNPMAQGYAPQLQGYAPQPQGYAPQPQGYAPPQPQYGQQQAPPFNGQQQADSGLPFPPPSGGAAY